VASAVRWFEEDDTTDERGLDDWLLDASDYVRAQGTRLTLAISNAPAFSLELTTFDTDSALTVDSWDQAEDLFF